MSILTQDAARLLDAADPLRSLRDRFLLPDGLIYLDGNSLGALPAATPALVDNVMRQQWGDDLISSWNKHDWIGAPQRIGAKIASLIGSMAHEVIVADSVSINLVKLVAGALSLRPGRRVILSEPGNFPTDLYMVQGLAELGLCELRLAPADQLVNALDQDVALLLLTHVHYKSACLHDMPALTKAAHDVGALALWDLSHSTGAVPVNLNESGADLAVGCGYKYLNGGPGAPAFLFVAERHQAAIRQPLSGWMGHSDPFAFEDDYRPASGMQRMLAGTPPILALAALEAGVDLIAEAGVPELFSKAKALSQLLCDGLLAVGTRHGLKLESPADPSQRGSHIAFSHPEAHALTQALIARGVVGDFRAPDILRLGIAPAILSYQDVARAITIMADVLDTGAWDQPDYRRRHAVT